VSGKKDGKDYASVYDFQSNTVVSDKMLGNGSLNYDWITMAQSGNYVVIRNDDGNQNPGILVYDRSLNFVRKVESYGEHGDVGYSVDGKDVYVQWNRSSQGTAAYPLDGSPRIDVLKGNWIGGHISCRNNKRPGWCYLSDAHGSSGDPGSNEVYAVKLDGSGTVERFAHTHNSKEPSYDATPMAVGSRDGSKVLWASDWQKGNSAPIYAYVAQMSGGTASTPTPIPTATPRQTATPNPSATKPPCTLEGDTDCDGKVTSLDLGYLLSKFGSNDPKADIDHSGSVNSLDLSRLLTNLGKSIG
jgi:hypothetical protein